MELTLVIEPAMHCTLLEAIRLHNVTSDQRLHIAHNVFAGLAHLHAKGFMHRDIKPSNVGISLRQPRAVLLDLGACIQSAKSSANAGTIPYLAPELLAVTGTKGSSYGHAVDVWSAGLTLTELVLGELIANDHWPRGITGHNYKAVRESLDELMAGDPNDLSQVEMCKVVRDSFIWQHGQRHRAEDLEERLRRLLRVRKEVTDEA